MENRGEEWESQIMNHAVLMVLGPGLHKTGRPCALEGVMGDKIAVARRTGNGYVRRQSMERCCRRHLGGGPRTTLRSAASCTPGCPSAAPCNAGKKERLC